MIYKVTTKMLHQRKSVAERSQALREPGNVSFRIHSQTRGKKLRGSRVLRISDYVAASKDFATSCCMRWSVNFVRSIGS